MKSFVIRTPGTSYFLEPEVHPCCFDTITVTPEGHSVNHWGTLNDAIRGLCFAAAQDTVPEASWGDPVGNSSNFETWRDTELGVEIPPFKPKTIPGTDSSSVYKVLAITDRGYVARHTGHIASKVRIRVQRRDDTIDCRKLRLNLSQDGRIRWFTIESDHLSYVVKSMSDAQLVVARGIYALLYAEKGKPWAPTT